MRFFRHTILFLAVVPGLLVAGQATPLDAIDPHFVAEDVRPHGSASPGPLSPGLLVWIFGSNLGRGCAVENTGDPATYQTELCGTRVLVGGIEARLIYAGDRQINLVVPDHPWEDTNVDFQVIRDGRASSLVPVWFGSPDPVLLSLAEPAHVGMPVWLRVEMPWVRPPPRLRYPFHIEPWDLWGGQIEVRSGAELLAPLPVPGVGRGPIGLYGGLIILGGPVPEKYMDRIPLHLNYDLELPGTYEVRYTQYRYDSESREDRVYFQSEWTSIEVLPSTSEQRREWFRALANKPPDDTVELLSDFLPTLLAARDEAALRLLAPYLDHTDTLVQRYTACALNYFDADLRNRVVPGREPEYGSVR